MCTRTYSRPATTEEYITTKQGYIEFIMRWQERKCIICGKTQQLQLET